MRNLFRLVKMYSIFGVACSLFLILMVVVLGEYHHLFGGAVALSLNGILFRVSDKELTKF